MNRSADLRPGVLNPLSEAAPRPPLFYKILQNIGNPAPSIRLVCGMSVKRLFGFQGKPARSEKGNMDPKICICCAGRMTAVSPRNPNLCLSCEQLVEDDSAELERLLSDADQSEDSNQVRPGEVEHEPALGGSDAHRSSTQALVHSGFVPWV